MANIIYYYLGRTLSIDWTRTDTDNTPGVIGWINGTVELDGERYAVGGAWLLAEGQHNEATGRRASKDGEIQYYRNTEVGDDLSRLVEALGISEDDEDAVDDLVDAIHRTLEIDCPYQFNEDERAALAVERDDSGRVTHNAASIEPPAGAVSEDEDRCIACDLADAVLAEWEDATPERVREVIRRAVEAGWTQ